MKVDIFNSTESIYFANKSDISLVENSFPVESLVNNSPIQDSVYGSVAFWNRFWNRLG
jgi:hypothetical protein